MAKRKDVVAVAGPFLGVKDDTTAVDPQYAQSMTNVMFADAGPAAGLVGRPGFSKHTSLTVTASGGALGVFEHVAIDGTRYKFVFANGKVYRWSWTSTSAGVSSFTDVTPVGVAISDRVSCVSFADTMIVSDGVNRPWKATNLSSTPITGAYLTGVPAACYGPPAVYYGKLFFIKGNERNTIIWSEENDPDTGYEAGGFNNAWTLAQTSNEPLIAIRATNEALYYWRLHSMGMITGAVNDEFTTAGVHDSLSETVGAITGWAVVEAGGAFYFMDAERRLQVYRQGQGFGELWREMSPVNYSVPVVSPADVQACYLPHERVAVFVVSTGSAPPYSRSGMLVVSTATDHALGTWSGGIGSGGYDQIAVVNDPLNVPRLVTLNDRLVGRGLYAQESTSAGTTRQTDYDGSTTTYPDCTVVCPMLGYDARVAKDFQLLTVVGTAAQTVRLDYATPRSGITTYGTAQSVTTTGEGRGTVGINAQSARWIRPRIRTAATAGAFSLAAVVVSGVPVTDAPGVV